MSDRRARDLLRELPPRKRLGERLLERVGRRGWARHRVAVSGRIFAKYNLADPYAPDSEDKDPIELGPVSLRLGEKRRQPAPHLRPKESKKKKKQADPLAKYRQPRPKVTPRSVEKRPEPPPPPPPSEADGLFGQRGATPALKGKLPVRPDLDTAGQPPAAPQPKKANSGRMTAQRRMPAAARRAPEPAPPPQQAHEDRRLPGLPPPKPKRKRAGRFSMAPVQTSGPVFEEIPLEEPAAPPDEEPAVIDAPEETPPKREIDRSIPTGPGGLDDLFGMADAGGRLDFGRKKKG